ncbi:mCG147694 [Mus musculus]|jgi:hypothetical protein|nr:mCG147694 [Mus musculus]
MMVFSFLHLIHSGTPVHDMVPPVYRVRLPTPPQVQRLVSIMILNPMNLTKKMNFHTCLGSPQRTGPHFNLSNNAVSKYSGFLFHNVMGIRMSRMNRVGGYTLSYPCLPEGWSLESSSS